MTKDDVMKKVSALKPEQNLLISVRKVKDDAKVQLEFAEIVVRKDKPIQMVGILNKSDDRFNGGPKARRAWMTVQKDNLKSEMGIDADSLIYVEEAKESNPEEKIQVCYLGKLGMSYDKRPIHLQVVETHNATEWDNENIERAAKQNGQGEYLLKDGLAIFSKVQVVAGKPNHVFIDHDEMSSVIPNVFEVVFDDNDVVEEKTAEAIV